MKFTRSERLPLIRWFCRKVFGDQVLVIEDADPIGENKASLMEGAMFQLVVDFVEQDVGLDLLRIYIDSIESRAGLLYAESDFIRAAELQHLLEVYEWYTEHRPKMLQEMEELSKRYENSVVIGGDHFGVQRDSLERYDELEDRFDEQKAHMLGEALRLRHQMWY